MHDQTDSKERFEEEYSSVKNHNFNSFDTMVEFISEREQFERACVCEVDRFGAGNDMVWGANWFVSRLPLLVIKGYLSARRYSNISIEG